MIFLSTNAPLPLTYIRALRENRTLSTSEKLAAVIMASHAGHDGTNAHPGIDLLAAEIGLKPRQTKTLVKSLTDKGWLAQTSSGRGNNRYASVYRLTIPQGAAERTLDDSQGAMDCTAKVQSTTSQGAMDCPTNQPVEISKEMPFNQSVSDDGGHSSSEGQDLTDGTGWEDYTLQTLQEEIADVFTRYVKEWADKPRFDPRFVSQRRWDELALVFNRHRMDTDDLIDGMFLGQNPKEEIGVEPAEHDPEKLTDPARFLGSILRGDLDKIVGYGERAKKIRFWMDTQEVERERQEEEAAKYRAEILAQMPDLSSAVPRVRPRAGAELQASQGHCCVEVWHHPDTDMIVRGRHSLGTPGTGWEPVFMPQSDWEQIEHQHVIELHPAMAARN